jgi:hypothetical protein
MIETHAAAEGRLAALADPHLGRGRARGARGELGRVGGVDHLRHRGQVFEARAVGGRARRRAQRLQHLSAGVEETRLVAELPGEGEDGFEVGARGVRSQAEEHGAELSSGEVPAWETNGAV